MTKTPFDTMMEMSQAWADAVNPGLSTFSPKDVDKLWPTMPKDWMDVFMGKTFNPNGLDAKIRMLLTIGGMTVQGVPAEPAFKTAVRHAAEAGATGQEIAETIAQMSLLAGVPAMTRAMGFAQEVLDEEEGA